MLVNRTKELLVRPTSVGSDIFPYANKVDPANRVDPDQAAA